MGSSARIALMVAPVLVLPRMPSATNVAVSHAFGIGHRLSVLAIAMVSLGS